MNRELVARLDDLATKWMKTCDTAAEVRDRVVLEQLLIVCLRRLEYSSGKDNPSLVRRRVDYRR